MENAEIEFVVFEPVTGAGDETVDIPGLYGQGPERSIGKFRDHDGQGRLVVILLAGGAHTESDAAAPVRDAGTLSERVQYDPEFRNEGGGGIDKAEVRLLRNLADLVQAVFYQLPGLLAAAVSE